MTNLQDFISEVAQESINSLISLLDIITRPEMLIYFMWLNFCLFNGLIREKEGSKDKQIQTYKKYARFTNALFLVFFLTRLVRNWTDSSFNILLSVVLVFAISILFVKWSLHRFDKMVK